MHTTDEVLAIMALRQWARDRQALRSGRIAQYRRRGWRDRRQRDSDAALVRVLDFETALATLTPLDQLLLIAKYRDGHNQDALADHSMLSVRTLAYALPRARRRLAAALDKLNLL